MLYVERVQRAMKQYSDVFLQLLDDPVEVIGNALELQAFDRMEEDIRVIGYFKSPESERECVHLCLCVCSSWKS